MAETLLNYLYILIFYMIPVVISVFLLDLLWIKRTQFYILDDLIASGWKGLIKVYKIVFTNDLEILNLYYGLDIFIYIFMLKNFLFLLFYVYIIQVVLNIVFSLILTQSVDIWLFFIVTNDAGDLCYNESFCQYKDFASIILISMALVQIQKNMLIQIEKNIIEFLNDLRNSLKIRTMIVHTFKEDGFQVINEINYFLSNNNQGKIHFFHILDNQQKKFQLKQKIRYLEYMKDHCIDKQQDGSCKNYLIPSKFYQEQYYKDKLQKIKQILTKYDFQQFSGVILVCLDDPKNLAPLIQNFKKKRSICERALQLRSQYEEILMQNHIYSVQEITDGCEIIWENITFKQKWESYKGILINLLAVFVILFLTTPSTLIHLLQIEKKSNVIVKDFILNSSLKNLILKNIQTLLIILFNQILLLIIHKLAFMEGHIVYTNFQLSKFYKSVRYLLLNMLIVPFIGIKTSDSLYVYLTNENTSYKEILQRQFSVEQNQSFLMLIFQSGFITFFCSILRFDELFYNYFSPTIATNLRQIQKDINNGFDYGYLSGLVLTIMAIVIFVSFKSPIICIIGVLYLFFRILVDTFNLTAVFKEEMSSNGSFYQKVLWVNIKIFTLILIYHSGFLFYNEMYVLSFLLLAYTLFFYIFLRLQYKKQVFFECIEQNQKLVVENGTDNKKKWLNFFKNPNQTSLDENSLEINI